MIGVKPAWMIAFTLAQNVIADVITGDAEIVHADADVVRGHGLEKGVTVHAASSFVDEDSLHPRRRQA